MEWYKECQTSAAIRAALRRAETFLACVCTGAPCNPVASSWLINARLNSAEPPSERNQPPHMDEG